MPFTECARDVSRRGASSSVSGVDTFDAIRLRRSVGTLNAPGPSEEALQAILEAASLAPDHKELRPWRFIIFRNEAKDAFGERLVDALLKREPGATEGQIDKERHKLDRAPVVIAAATKRIDTSLPFEELLASTAAAVQNLLLAATDLGFGTIWRTGEMATDANVKRALGIDVDDSIVGFIYIGTSRETDSFAARASRLDASIAWDWQP